MGFRMKLCIILMLASSFVLHFSIAAEEEGDELQTVLEILGVEDISEIKDYTKFDDYEDYVNDLKWDAVQIVCAADEELPLCKVWSRLKTAEVHYHAVSESLNHLEHRLRESDRQEGRLYIKDSCAKPEVSSWMIPACKAFSQYARVLGEIKRVASPVEGKEFELRGLKSQLDEKGGERTQLKSRRVEKSGELEQLESQSGEEWSKLKSLESQLEKEKGRFSWVYSWAYTSDKEKDLIRQIEDAQDRVEGIDNNMERTKREGESIQDNIDSIGVNIERTKNEIWRTEDEINNMEDDIEEEIEARAERDWGLVMEKWDVTAQMALAAGCNLKKEPENFCNLLNRTAEHQRVYYRIEKELHDTAKAVDDQIRQMCKDGDYFPLSLCNHLLEL